jgi:two-component system response regulator YesN
MDNHYDEDITLEEVSSILNLSPQYFSRVFHEKTGVTFVDYLTRVRIKKAKDWLTYSQSNVQEVCFKVGYKDPNYFTRVFQKTVGVTPRQYKAQKSL